MISLKRGVRPEDVKLSLTENLMSMSQRQKLSAKAHQMPVGGIENPMSLCKLFWCFLVNMADIAQKQGCTRRLL
jgi:hypothetical protein